jgi:hypothetical protein
VLFSKSGSLLRDVLLAGAEFLLASELHPFSLALRTIAVIA